MPPRRILRCLAGVLLLVVPCSTAQELPVSPGSPGPAVPLSAALHRPPTVRAAGILAMAPDGLDHYATLRLASPPAMGGAPWMKADLANFTVVEWVSGPVGHLQLESLLPPVPLFPKPPRLGNLRDVTATFVAARDAPQLLLKQLVGQDFGAMRPRAATCDITPGEPGLRPFPDDLRHVPSSTQYYATHPGLLTAECLLASFDADRPPRAYVYDLEVRLDSPDLEGGRSTISTGTFEETRDGVETGRRVTRMLVVEQRDQPYQVTIPVPQRARFAAHTLAIVGGLQVGAAQGEMRWGPLRETGRLDPVDAEGVFSLERGTFHWIQIDGHTWNGPPVAAAGAGPAWAGIGWTFAAAGALSLVAFAARWLWPLFTRLLPERLLEHARRAGILEFVRLNPGVELNTVAHALGLGWAVASHHVRALRRGGRVVVHRVGGRTALFVANVGHRGQEVPMALLRRPTHRRVHELLVARPGLDQKTLAALVELTRPRVCQVLRDLVQAGIVVARPLGRRLAYSPREPSVLGTER